MFFCCSSLNGIAKLSCVCLLIFALIINVVDVVGVVSLGTVFEVVGRTEEANLQLIDFIYVAEKEKEAAETQRKLAYGVHNSRE